MSQQTPRRLLVQEVEELTELLRSSPTLEFLRPQLEERGVSVNRCLFGGMIEGEDGTVLGLVVESRRVIHTFETDEHGEIVSWARVRNVAPLTEAFEAARVAVELAELRPIVD